MVISGYIPEEGDIVWLDLEPQAGHEQKGRRPALVLTPSDYNRIGLMIICPITNQEKGYPFEVSLKGIRIKTTGAVLADQVKSIDWKARNADFKEKMPDVLISKVKDRIALLLQLS